MYCLGVFYKNVYHDYYGVPSFILIGCCVSELHPSLCLYCNVWPEVVYCCLQELHCLPNCLLVSIIRVIGFSSPGLVALHLPFSQIAKYIAWVLS